MNKIQMVKSAQKKRPGELTEDQLQEVQAKGFFKFDGRALHNKDSSIPKELDIEFFGNVIEHDVMVEMEGHLAMKARLRPDFTEYKAGDGKEVVEPPSYIFPRSTSGEITGSVKVVSNGKPAVKARKVRSKRKDGIMEMDDSNDADFADL